MRISALLILVLEVSAIVSAQPRQILPQEIRTALNSLHPKWRFAPIDSTLQRQNEDARADAYTGFITGDFDGDRRKDFAVHLMARSGSDADVQDIVVAFVRTDTGYQHSVLEATDFTGQKYIALAPRGTPLSIDTETGMENILQHDGIEVFYGLEASTTYVFTDGAFVDISADD